MAKNRPNRLAIFLCLLGSGSILLQPATAQCPSRCRCVYKTSESNPRIIEQLVDCSGQRISNLQGVLSSLSGNTTILDLRVNDIRFITTDAFAGLPNLAVLLLDDNLIDSIEPHAFRGLHNVRTLSLTKNRLKTIRSESFMGLSGTEGECEQALGETKVCAVHLQQNDIEIVERHAFAWMKRLQVFLGRSKVSMTVEAYAFYGARGIQRLSIAQLPNLTLQARIFTNTENIESVEISNTAIGKLDAFVFEGLKNVNSITFKHVRIANITSYAFAGVIFRNVNKTKNDYKDEDLENSNQDPATDNGGSVYFIDCDLDNLHADIFRDTHLSKIRIEDSRIVTMQGNVFRGVFGLRSIHLVRNVIASLASSSFGSLRSLQEFVIQDNKMRTIPTNVFYEVSDIETIRIDLCYNTTLEREAFAGIFNVRTFEIIGNNAGSKPYLIVKPGAFRNLVSVEVLQLSNVGLPVLDSQAFSGMTKIKTLRLTNGDVSRIDRHAFGEPYSNIGAIEHVDLSEGNNLMCDCQTTAVLRDLANKFASTSIGCRSTADPNGVLLFVDDVAAQPASSCRSAATLTYRFNIWLVLLTLSAAYICLLIHFES